MNTPERKNFAMSKVKIPNSGGLYVEFKYNQSIRDEYHEIFDKHQSSVEPHPDLAARIRSLKDYFIEVTRLKFMYRVIMREQFKASDEQVKIANAAIDELKRYVKITQISKSGKDDNKGVVITGVIEAETGQGMAYNTHRIKLNDEVYGWEEDLTEIVDDIQDEVYSYIYESKVALPDMFENSLADVEEPEESDEDQNEDGEDD